MNAALRRRLAAIRNKLEPQQFVIVAIDCCDETEEELDAKLDRWRAGEDIRGIRGDAYDRRNAKLLAIRYFAPRPRTDHD